MPTLATATIAHLLEPYFPAPSALLLDQLSTYLDLLVKWNSRTNLSAIREPERMVERHFGESLFAARHLPQGHTLLDIGSGAGFPGLPIALAHPGLNITLTESQNKKASFLREAVRTLQVPVEVWAGRVEDLPAPRLFDIVTLRAVDNPMLALELARHRLALGGSIVHLTGAPTPGNPHTYPIPNSASSFLEILA